MFKKATALILSFAMLLSIGTSVSAAQADASTPTEVTEVRTMEDILNDYHDQIFDLEPQTNTNARSAQTAESITQNTVNELKSAGYEAYHVNADTYADVEDTLQTDLSAIGISEESGDFIIVAYGEEDSTSTSQSRIGEGLLPPNIDNGGSSFTYTYNGTNYTLRYLNVTAANNSSYRKSSYYDALQDTSSGITVATVLDTIISAVLDEISEELHLGTIASICGLSVSDFASTNVVTGFETLLVRGRSVWTRTFTQVYDSANSQWATQLHVEYVKNSSYIEGDYYDKYTNDYASIPEDQVSWTSYSSHYDDTTWRKRQAVIGFKNGVVYYDFTGAVEFKYGGDVVITHLEDF